MMRAFGPSFLAVLGLLIAPAAAAAAVIDFSAQPEGNNPNPLVLPGATFSTIGGFNYVVNAFGSNTLCPSTSPSSAANCSHNLEVLFDAPGFGISFTVAGNNDTNVGNDIGDVQVFAGATLLGTVDVIVLDGDFTTHDLVSLAGFSGVTRLLISSTDLGGVTYDDFTFNEASVPEPASWVMMMAGFGLIGAAVRRRRRV